MKFTGLLFLILGILLLIGGIAAMFAAASIKIMGGLIVFSVIFNAVGITLLTVKK